MNSVSHSRTLYPWRLVFSVGELAVPGATGFILSVDPGPGAGVDLQSS